MLHLIPAPLHRQLYRLAHFARHCLYRLTKPLVHGCSVVGRDGDGRFLLVRHSYGPAVWAFPGGGMKGDEDPLVAARREFAEELGCDLADARLLCLQEDAFLGADNVVRVVSGRVVGEVAPDLRELVEARFFAREDFPANLSPSVAKRLAALDAASEQR